MTSEHRKCGQTVAKVFGEFMGVSTVKAKELLERVPNVGSEDAKLPYNVISNEAWEKLLYDVAAPRPFDLRAVDSCFLL